MDVRDLSDGIALDAFLQVDVGDANVDEQLGAFFEASRAWTHW